MGWGFLSASHALSQLNFVPKPSSDFIYKLLEANPGAGCVWEWSRVSQGMMLWTSKPCSHPKGDKREFILELS